LTPNLDAGCLFYAARQHGAYCRRLSDPWGGTVHMASRVSSIADPASAVFSESAEKSHGSHGLTTFVAEKLGIRAGPIRMDGQGKYAVVGNGGADIFFRLPRPGYREKIWDQAPGYLFIREAGGVVTDLEGNDLDFSLGRQLR
jgi:3'(2'), 5'-bisphosphate nucleotidase/inositol polyphosphate 1-phosphatase